MEQKKVPRVHPIRGLLYRKCPFRYQSQGQGENGRGAFQPPCLQHALPTFDGDSTYREFRSCTRSQSTMEGKEPSAMPPDHPKRRPVVFVLSVTTAWQTAQAASRRSETLFFTWHAENLLAVEPFLKVARRLRRVETGKGSSSFRGA
ncbi:unnamed protein product [Ixodes persulcatus]